MSRKSFFISMLALFVSLAWVLEASAVTCSRCRRSPWGLCLEEVLKGLGNVDKNETYSNITIGPESLIIESWLNPGGGDGGIGQPFSFSFPTGAITISEEVTQQMVKNGKAIVDMYIPGCFIWDLFFCAGLLRSPECVYYECLTREDPDDSESNCIDWNYHNCLIYGGVCPKETGYDYSLLPDAAFPANGNRNWSPEPLSCDPGTFDLGSLDNDGNLIIVKMWVVSQKTVWDCPIGVKSPEDGCFDDDLDTDCSCSSESPVVDYACLQLKDANNDGVYDEDETSYDRVAPEECTNLPEIPSA